MVADDRVLVVGPKEKEVKGAKGMVTLPASGQLGEHGIVKEVNTNSAVVELEKEIVVCPYCRGTGKKTRRRNFRLDDLQVV